MKQSQETIGIILLKAGVSKSQVSKLTSLSLFKINKLSKMIHFAESRSDIFNPTSRIEDRTAKTPVPLNSSVSDESSESKQIDNIEEAKLESSSESEVEKPQPPPVEIKRGRGRPRKNPI